MELFEAIARRRSVRRYRNEPVGRDVLERIVAAGIEAPSGCNLQLRQYIIVDEPRIMEQLRPISAALTGAPAAIVVLVEPKASKFGLEFWIQDASAAMENMLLAAVDLGYAACWVEGAIRPVEDKLRTLLGVPETLRIWSLLPVGRPEVAPARPEKSGPAEVTHYNRFAGSGSK